MIQHPDFDPIAFSVGPLRVHWYGLMYLAGFAAAWWLGRRRAREPWRGWQAADMDDVLFYAALGVVVGGRLGYVLFYDFQRFASDPISIIQVWQGGMSFHGGLLGVIVAMALFARGRGWSFFKVADFVAPLVPPGLLAGRLGNFINGNLWGQPTDLPWGVVFPDPRAGGVPRHPSQLYEGLLEGVALFAVLWLFSRSPRPLKAVSGVFLLGYGVARAVVEFVRVPDGQIGYLAFDWFTMGQALSVPMIGAGVVLIIWAYARPQLPQTSVPAAKTTVPPVADKPRGGKSGRKSGKKRR